MERNHCDHFGLLIDTILACFDPDVIMSLQRSFGPKQPKVCEEMSKIDFQDSGCGGHRGFSTGSFSYFVSTKHPNAHHQVSTQLDYSRDAQNMTTFSHINV